MIRSRTNATEVHKGREVTSSGRPCMHVRIVFSVSNNYLSILSPWVSCMWAQAASNIMTYTYH